jgi:hypothetical protein
VKAFESTKGKGLAVFLVAVAAMLVMILILFG